MEKFLSLRSVNDNESKRRSKLFSYIKYWIVIVSMFASKERFSIDDHLIFWGYFYNSWNNRVKNIDIKSYNSLRELQYSI